MGKGISELKNLTNLSISIGSRNKIGGDGCASLGKGISELRDNIKIEAKS